MILSTLRRFNFRRDDLSRLNRRAILDANDSYGIDFRIEIGSCNSLWMPRAGFARAAVASTTPTLAARR